jgi:hypothetical protein
MSNASDTAVRSPSYPVWSLAEAVTAVGKIEAVYRVSKVDREAAAKLIGYSGLSGPANKALASLAQYGLVERAGKGEMRVTPRARAILHPDSTEEKRDELRAAALEPQLFRELQERWPGITPPEEGVVLYLNRKGFNQSAIRPAAKAYLNTLLYMEEFGGSESHGVESPPSAESSATQPTEPKMQAQTAATTPATVAPPLGDVNAINMNIRGDKVHLEGLLDYDGLLDLETKLAALKLLLPKPKAATVPPEEGAPN